MFLLNLFDWEQFRTISSDTIAYQVNSSGAKFCMGEIEFADDRTEP